MLKQITLGVSIGILGSALTASAASTTYADQSFTVAAGDSAEYNTTVTTALDPQTGVVLDPDSGDADPEMTRYYGGTFSYTPNENGGAYSGGISLKLLRDDGATVLQFGRWGGWTDWTFQGGDSGGNGSIGIPGSGELPFVIKIHDSGYNRVQADLWWGAAAETPDEGAPSKSIGILSQTLTSVPLTDYSVTFEDASWANGAAAGSLEGFFSSTEWQPVGAPIPEPASAALLASAFAMASMTRRRRGQ